MIVPMGSLGSAVSPPRGVSEAAKTLESGDWTDRWAIPIERAEGSWPRLFR